MRDALDTARNNSHSVDRKSLRQLAQRTCSMLTQSGVEHWLDFGSLLGLMREGNILEGDTDVDISVVDTPENVEKLEKSRAPLADMGIFLKKELTWNAYRAASSLGYVHLYLTQLVNHTYQGGIGDGSEISSELVGKPTLFDLEGTQVAIPQHTHAFLVARYGDDYMDPDAFYANATFLGRHPGSDGWNELVQLREQKKAARMAGRVADAVQQTTTKLALQPAPQPAAQPAAVATAVTAPMAAVQQLGLSGPDLEAASAALSRHLVSYERRLKDSKDAHELTVRADSGRSAMALDSAVQHHKQVLENLQAQLDLTTHPATRSLLQSQIEQHQEAAGHAEAEAAALAAPPAPAAAMPQVSLYRKSGAARGSQNIAKQQAMARAGHTLAPHADGADSSARPREGGAPPPLGSREGWAAPSWAASPRGAGQGAAAPPRGVAPPAAAVAPAAALAPAAAVPLPGWAPSGARSEARARSEQRLRGVQSESHTSERDAHALARKAKDAAHERRLHEYAARIAAQADSDRAALALGATKQHENELVDNLENRFASTTDVAARELLRAQISSHREAAARASLEAATMHGSEERHNGLTRDKMSQARTKRLLLRAERPNEAPSEDLLQLVRQH